MPRSRANPLIPLMRTHRDISCWRSVQSIWGPSSEMFPEWRTQVFCNVLLPKATRRISARSGPKFHPARSRNLYPARSSLYMNDRVCTSQSRKYAPVNYRISVSVLLIRILAQEETQIYIPGVNAGGYEDNKIISAPKVYRPNYMLRSLSTGVPRGMALAKSVILLTKSVLASVYPSRSFLYFGKRPSFSISYSRATSGCASR